MHTRFQIEHVRPAQIGAALRCASLRAPSAAVSVVSRGVDTPRGAINIGAAAAAASKNIALHDTRHDRRCAQSLDQHKYQNG